MTNDEIKTRLTTAQTVGLTAFYEAQAQFLPGKGWVPSPTQALADVVNVIFNRARAKGTTPKAECLRRAQFSCWAALDGTKNNTHLIVAASSLLLGNAVDPRLMDCVAMAVSAQTAFTDTLDGATHYYAPESMVPVGSVPPWAAPPAQLVVARYGHRFYNHVEW